MILVTGASGNVGQSLVNQLIDKGAPLRLVTRDKSRLGQMPHSVEVVEGEMIDVAFLKKALKGIDSLFLFPLIADQSNQSTQVMVDEAKASGVKHIVMLSSMSAANPDSEIGKAHRDIELLIEGSGIAWTFVRPTAFMTNVLWWLPQVAAQGKVFSATGEGRVAPISQVDIAAVCAEALTADGQGGKIYNLTGPELVSAQEQVRLISETIGRPIEYVEVPAEAIAEQMAKTGTPQFIIAGMIKNWARIKSGQAEKQTPDLEQITGSKGQTFELWCRQQKDELLAELAKAEVSAVIPIV